MASTSGAVINIQYLRAIAALMVVWVHAREQFGFTLQMFPSAVGSHGVDLFFVISGFIMVYTTRGRDSTPGQFLWRRFLRIAPLYWLITLTIVAIALLLPHLLKSTVLVPSHVLGSFAFFPMPSPAFPAHYWPLLVPGWTLNYEMAFYALFAACLWLPAAWRTLALCATLLGLVVLGEALGTQGRLDFYTDAIILTFGTGAILGELYCRGWLQRRGRMAGVAALLAGVGLWLLGQSLALPHRFVAAGLPATLVVAGACAIGPLHSAALKWLEALGDATYSIYLGHILMLGVLRVVCAKLGFTVASASHAWVFMLLALGVSAVGGWLLYRWVETPMASLVSRWARSRRTVA